MVWGINRGITSSSSNGVRSHTAAGHFSDTKKKCKSTATGKHRQYKLTDEEVKMIRALDESGTMKRKEIYYEHVIDKMSFAGMCLILDYITRTKGLTF